MTAQPPEYSKRWRLDRALGRPRLVDARPVRVHVDQLLVAGMSLRSIAAAAGVSTTAVMSISHGDYETCLVRTARAILAVDAVRGDLDPQAERDAKTASRFDKALTFADLIWLAEKGIAL